MLPLLLLFSFISIINGAGTLKKISPNQLDQYTSKYEYILALFTSNSNEQFAEMSRRIRDELETVALQFSSDNRIRFYEVSLDEKQELVAQYGMVDIPSIVIWRDGLHRNYYGQKLKQVVFPFLTELLTQDPLKSINLPKIKKQFTDDMYVRIVGYFPKEAGEEYEAFKKAAKHFQGDLTFGVVNDEKTAKSFKLKEPNTIAIMKPGERAILGKQSYTNRDDLVNFINQNRHPLWEILTYNNLYRVWQGKKHNFICFIKNLEDFASKSILSIFKSIAKEYGESKDVEFLLIDAGVYKEFVQGMGLEEWDVPTFGIYQMMNGGEMFFPKDKMKLDLENAKKWLDDFLEGKLESGPKKIYNAYDNIKSLTEDNFEEIVQDDSKDVLVRFFNPSEEQEESIQNYKLLGKLFRSLPSIYIAAFDTSLYTPPKEHSQGLVLFPSGEKNKPVKYDGDDKSIDIVQFILNHQKSLDPGVAEELLATLLSYADQFNKDLSLEERDEL